MSGDFLSRWSRRKLELRQEQPGSVAAPDASVEGAAADSQEAVEDDDSLTPEEIAALPKIEELTPETDIRMFLKKGVPELLRNSAFRRMWSLDPAIRDYVSEAREYAYDWNVPGGVPGNGPLLPSDNVEEMLGQIFGDRPRLPEFPAGHAIAEAPPLPPGCRQGRSRGRTRLCRSHLNARRIKVQCNTMSTLPRLRQSGRIRQRQRFQQPKAHPSTLPTMLQCGRPKSRVATTLPVGVMAAQFQSETIRKWACSLPIASYYALQADETGRVVQNRINGMEMREGGLEETFRVAGGVGVPANALAVSRPALSRQDEVSSGRVLSNQAFMEGSHSSSRQDPIIMTDETVQTEVDDIDLLRSHEYGLLALLFGRAPTVEVLAQAAQLKGDATPLGLAHIHLAELARILEPDAVSREYFDLFVGIGRGEVLPYASYYMTGFLHERPLARIRADLARLGIERSDEQREPEDHIAILCDVMAGLASGRLGRDFAAERDFFDRHVKPWASRLFADCEMAQHATFYKAAGAVGRMFMELEAEAFAMEKLSRPGLLLEDAMTDKKSKAIDRRNFLRTVGGASTVVAAAVASPIAATDAQAYDPGSEETRARYRESEDVKAFYRTNGYETLKK